MQTIIFFLTEGVSAVRMPASDAVWFRDAVQPDGKGPDIYLVDGCGRTWAPLPDGEWCLWEDCYPFPARYETVVEAQATRAAQQELEHEGALSKPLDPTQCAVCRGYIPEECDGDHRDDLNQYG